MNLNVFSSSVSLLRISIGTFVIVTCLTLQKSTQQTCRFTSEATTISQKPLLTTDRISLKYPMHGIKDQPEKPKLHNDACGDCCINITHQFMMPCIRLMVI